jgi:thymidylate synthase
MATLLKATSLYNAWYKAVREVSLHGEEVFDERFYRTKEVQNLIIEIRKPLMDITQHDYWFGDKLRDYEEQILDPEKGSFIYTYGNRLRGYFVRNRDLDPEIVDQVERVIHRIQESQATRRATMVTLDPEVDHYREEMPCIISIDFKVRNQLLDTTVFWRSNDIYGAYYPNIKGMLFLANFVAMQTKTKINSLTTHTTSGHIYEYDLENAKEVALKKRRLV